MSEPVADAVSPKPPQGEEVASQGDANADDVSQWEALAQRVAWLEQRLAHLEQRQLGPAQRPVYELAAYRTNAQGQAPATPVGPPELPAKSISSMELIAGAGALIFLIGAGFFLYWSIERGWLSPAIRVGLGVVTGLGLGAAAIKMMFGEARGLGMTLYIAGLGTLMFSFFYGAMVAQLFAPTVGFVAVGFLAGGSGLLALRLSSAAVLAIGYGLGLAAPLAFSTGTRNYPLLLGYLLLLQCLATVVIYASKLGASWVLPRTLSVLGTWLLVVAAVADSEPDQAVVLAGLSWAIFAGSVVWVWLPKHRGAPTYASFLWLWSSASVSVVAAMLSRTLGVDKWQFGLLMIAQSLFSVAIAWLVRGRLANAGNALVGPVASALIYAVIAAPMLIQNHWVVPAWAAMALSVALLGQVLPTRFAAATKVLGGAAAGLTVVTLTGWLYIMVERPGVELRFLNAAFVSAAMITAACGVLTLRPTAVKASGPAFVCAELMFHVAIGIELGRVLTGPTSALIAAFASTIFFALSAAAQYLLAVSGRAGRFGQILSTSAYVLFGVAAVKLLLFDLDSMTMVVRALGALGIGVIFIAAALAANRLNERRKSSETSSSPDGPKPPGPETG